MTRCMWRITCHMSPIDHASWRSAALIQSGRVVTLAKDQVVVDSLCFVDDNPASECWRGRTKKVAGDEILWVCSLCSSLNCSLKGPSQHPIFSPPLTFHGRSTKGIGGYHRNALHKLSPQPLRISTRDHELDYIVKCALRRGQKPLLGPVYHRELA